MFKVINVDGPTVVTDKGNVSVVPTAYADGNRAAVMGPDAARFARDLVARGPELVAVLRGLHDALVTAQEEQTSAKMGFGKTQEEKKQRVAQYESWVRTQCYKFDDLLDAAFKLLSDIGHESFPGRPELFPKTVGHLRAVLAAYDSQEPASRHGIRGTDVRLVAMTAGHADAVRRLLVMVDAEAK